MFNSFDKIRYSGSALIDIVKAMPEPAHIKDINTKKYLYTNASSLNIYGLSNPDDVVGTTLDDLAALVPNWDKKFIDETNDLESEVQKTNATVNQKRIFTTAAGLIRIECTTKIPIFEYKRKNKISSILTFSQNLTPFCKLYNLFQLYKRYYHKKFAVNKFLIHIGLSKFFHTELTESELLIILAKKDTYQNKDLAQAFRVSVKTVETHLYNIKSKIINNDMAIVLKILQAYNTNI